MFPRAFQDWRREWSDYATVTQLASQSQETQLAKLRLCMTPATRHTLVHILKVEPDAQLKVSEVLD